MSRTLDPYSELRLRYSDTLGFASGANVSFGATAHLSEGMVVVRRYIGVDEKGHRVEVPVQLRLDPGVGTLVKRPVSADEEGSSSRESVGTSEVLARRASPSGRPVTLSGTYEGQETLVSPRHATAELRATFVQTGDAVSGSYTSVLRDTGTFTGRVTGELLFGRGTSARDSDTCDFYGEVSAEGAMIEGTFACKSGATGSFRLRRF